MLAITGIGNLPTLFTHNGHIKRYCLLSICVLTYRFTSAFMHAKSMHIYTLPKICYNYSRNNIPPLYHSSVALLYKIEGWHILYWKSKPTSDFMQPLYHYFNRLPAWKWRLVQKDLESTLVHPEISAISAAFIHGLTYWKGQLNQA